MSKASMELQGSVSAVELEGAGNTGDSPGKLHLLALTKLP